MISRGTSGTLLIPDQVKSTCCTNRALDTQMSCKYTLLSEKQGLIPEAGGEFSLA